MQSRLPAALLLLAGLSGCIGGGGGGDAPSNGAPSTVQSVYFEPPELPPRNPYRGTGASPPPQPAPAVVPQANQSAAAAQAAAETPNATAPAEGYYRVQAGDTVYAISRRFGVPIRRVIEANNLQPPYTLSINQRLIIPTQRVHVVEAGQTVYGISRVYGVDLTELTRLNEIQPPYTIQVGQRLALPAASGSTQTTSAQAQTLTAAQSVDVPAGTSAPTVPQPPAEEQAASIPPPVTTGAIPSPPAREGGKFLWPLNGQIISTFGAKDGGLHNDGINIAAPVGASVVAAENGVVVYAGNELRGFGNLLLIKHTDGWVTAYAHNERLLVGRGQEVRRGQEIAKVGQSGSVTSPQLHFEIRKGSRAINPQEMLGPQQAAN